MISFKYTWDSREGTPVFEDDLLADNYQVLSREEDEWSVLNSYVFERDYYYTFEEYIEDTHLIDDYDSITEFSIWYTKIKDFSGLSKFKNLESLGIYYTDLTGVSSIESNSLKEISFCQSIWDGKIELNKNKNLKSVNITSDEIDMSNCIIDIRRYGMA